MIDRIVRGNDSGSRRASAPLTDCKSYPDEPTDERDSREEGRKGKAVIVTEAERDERERVVDNQAHNSPVVCRDSDHSRSRSRHAGKGETFCPGDRETPIIYSAKLSPPK